MEVITVFNKYFERVDVLRKYTFMQYVDKFNGVGEFKINAILCDENLYFFDKKSPFLSEEAFAVNKFNYLTFTDFFAVQAL